MFELYADRGMLIKLYDEAVAEQDRRLGERRGDPQRRAALGERLAELDLERKGYLRQNARGVLSDGELDAMLSEVDARRDNIAAELRGAEDAAAELRRIHALRACLLSAEWFEAPEVVQPYEYLSGVASQEEIRRAYRRFGARFEVDGGGALTLRLNLSLDGGPLHFDSSSL